VTPKIQNSILVIVSLLFALYTGEIILSFTPKQPISEERAQKAQQAGIEFDSRTKFEVVEDLRAKGLNAFPGIHLWLVTKTLGPDAALYPLSGAANQLTVFGNESGKYITYVSDQYGFNNPAIRWQNPPTIALVGDSFAQGAYVPNENNIAGILNKNKLPTLNLGIVGAGPLIQLGIIKEYLTALKPEITLWFFFEGNDLLDLQRESPFAILKKYLRPDFRQDLPSRQQELNRFQANYLEKQLDLEREYHQGMLARQKRKVSIATTKQNSYKSAPSILSLRYIRHLVSDVLQSTKTDRKLKHYDIPLFKEILSTAKETTEKWGGKFYFVYLPAWERYGLKDKPDLLHYRKQVLDTAYSLNLPCIDIHNRFKQLKDPTEMFPFQLTGHYTIEGYQIVSETIMNFLSDFEKRDKESIPYSCY
tara:strand:+ start:1384 stop:2643 length:1260 start_codon:yes stop_codon:yes gene_type:complete